MQPSSACSSGGFRKGVTIFISLVFLCFLGYILIRYRYLTYILKEQLFTTPLFWSMAAAYAALSVVGVFLYRNLKTSPPPWAYALLLFCLALALRIAMREVLLYYPQSDYYYYYEMGRAYAAGNYAYIGETAAWFQIPDFVGTGVLFGLICKYLAATVAEFQLVQCVVTSLICMLTYLVARRIQPRAAFVAGFLFALYPSNIIYTQVTVNQHLNVLFALVAILLFLQCTAAKRLATAIPLAVGSGFFLMLAQYAHPSILVTVIAFSLYAIVLVLAAWKDKKQVLRLALSVAAVAAALVGGRALSNVYFDSLHMREPLEGVVSYSPVKLVFGLSPESGGMWSEADLIEIRSVPKSEQIEKCYEIVRRRLPKTAAAWIDLFDTKIIRMWMLPDASFGWSVYGLEGVQADEIAAGNVSPLRDAMMERVEQCVDAYQLLDFFYVAAVYLLSFIGVCSLKFRSGESDLLLWTVLGWLSAHLFIEIQSRYRYYAMPFLMIFAAFGVVFLCDQAGRLGGKAASVYASKRLSHRSEPPAKVE